MTPAVTQRHLQFAALSDVGRVRKDNQDSGYAGPWLLTVCDGVGGAARGDIASSTAVQQLLRLDEKPGEDMLGAVAGAIHRAHDRIGELVEEDPALGGTSTTATALVFDGEKVAVGHVGDSRAYLYRDGTLSQLTRDHTFVQTLIDEGRITEEESRVHPHRNLILKAIDGVHEVEPDLFQVEVEPGDRLLVCSDGASGVLDDARIADILGTGTPEYAAVELVRASLEAGSSDNVTCVVADVVESETVPTLTPMLVGAAADLPRRRTPGAVGAVGSLFRGHRSGDTGELEPVPDEIPGDLPYAIPNDPIDPEHARYAPRAPRRFGWLKALLALTLVAGLAWVGVAAAWSWSQNQYFVGEHDGVVTIYRGIRGDLPGVRLSKPYESSDIELAHLPSYDASVVRQGIVADDLTDARRKVDDLKTLEACPTEQPTPAATSRPTASPTSSPTGSPTRRPTATSTAGATTSPKPGASRSPDDAAAAATRSAGPSGSPTRTSDPSATPTKASC